MVQEIEYSLFSPHIIVSDAEDMDSLIIACRMVKTPAGLYNWILSS